MTTKKSSSSLCVRGKKVYSLLVINRTMKAIFQSKGLVWIKFQTAPPALLKRKKIWERLPIFNTILYSIILDILSSYSSMVKLSSVLASGRCVVGTAIASPSAYPPFRLLAIAHRIDNGLNYNLDVLVQKQEMAHSYSVKKYFFQVAVPLELMKQSQDDVAVVVYDGQGKILEQSILSPIAFKQPFGKVDGFSDKKAWGWAWHPDYPNLPVRLKLEENNGMNRGAIANRYRPDLYKAGLGDGCHGFEMFFETPEDRELIKNLFVVGGKLLTNHLSLELPNNGKYDQEEMIVQLRKRHRITLR